MRLPFFIVLPVLVAVPSASLPSESKFALTEPVKKQFVEEYKYVFFVRTPKERFVVKPADFSSGHRLNLVSVEYKAITTMLFKMQGDIDRYLSNFESDYKNKTKRRYLQKFGEVGKAKEITKKKYKNYWLEFTHRIDIGRQKEKVVLFVFNTLDSATLNVVGKEMLAMRVVDGKWRVVEFVNDVVLKYWDSGSDQKIIISE